ncbi:transposase IS4 family protein [mine drainage metagenome]|uniref:Transposase IS4 family protein n=2 Tax=mine drainage metagenome TaxID=410659 RepID=T1CL72_9ZZZZ
MDTVYSRGDLPIRRVNAIQEASTKAWASETGRDSAHHLVYSDVCRIVYNGNDCAWAEWGHGPEGRPHIGIAMVTGRKYHFPHFSMPVKGSMHDSKTLLTIADELKRRGMHDLTMVLDRAYLSEKNVSMAQSAHLNLLGGCRDGSTEVSEALRRWKDEEIQQPGEVIIRSRDSILYYRGWEGKLFGSHGQIVVTLDPMRMAMERGTRDRILMEMRKNKNPAAIKTIREELGSIAVSSPGRKGWKVDWDTEKKERMSDGRFVIFTTDMTMSPEEIVEAYFQRDEIEKAFRELKSSASMAPIRYRLWNRVDVYLSVICHEAYLIRAGIRQRLRKAGMTESVDDVIRSLGEVYMVKDLVEKGSVERWGPITKEKKDLIKALGIGDLITTY